MLYSKRLALFHVFLIRPSKYDDEGFVIRHWRGVLPSNTLGCLHGLTEDVRRRGLLGDVDVRVHVIDEAVTKVPLEKIARLHRRSGERVLAGLVGVQTNQFCRARDIALALRREGVPVMIGGFHVSGVAALFSPDAPDIQELVNAGVTVVAGEVEHRWADLLLDAYHKRLKPIYNFLSELPDLSEAPRPIVDKRHLRKFVSSNFGTIDCSRGCPFNCSFCTIINVQGRKSRHRSPECIADTIRRNYLESGVHFYFFTDDNFARNPGWKEIFERLIRMREEERIPVDFMMQVDVLSHRIPGFVEMAARAGCSNVFIGMESINPRNLKDAGKTQNHVQEYTKLIETWHNARISTHTAYIIGFPQDTEESVREDLDRLMNEIRPHRATFFMMTPIPGSRDHKRLVEAGVLLDADYNNYDSFHQNMAHPNLKNGAWQRIYREAWEKFYSFENMKAILSRAHPENYWDIFKQFYWYKNSALNEGAHPMMAGFFRLKDRTSRRACFPQEGRLRHMRRRFFEIYRYMRDALRLTLEMEELWLATRRRTETELRVLEELAQMRAELCRSLRVSELQMAYARARARMPSIEVPSRVALLWEKVSVVQAGRLRETRRDLSLFWNGVRQRLRQGRVDTLLRLDRLALNALREVRLATGFFIALATAEETPQS